MILINKDKETRAKEILDLINGKTPVVSEEQEQRKDRFAEFLATDEVDPKGKEALQYVYEKLGGLVVSEAEAKKIDERKKEAKAKARKRAIE